MLDNPGEFNPIEFKSGSICSVPGIALSILHNSQEAQNTASTFRELIMVLDVYINNLKYTRKNVVSYSKDIHKAFEQ